MSSTIYLDIGSIHNEVLRRHPEITKSAAYLNRSTTGPWAVICDTTECADGQQVEVYRRDKEDYHGFAVEISRWRPVKDHSQE